MVFGNHLNDMVAYIYSFITQRDCFISFYVVVSCFN